MWSIYLAVLAVLGVLALIAYFNKRYQFRFAMALFLACLIKWKLSRYRVLYAQAMHETAWLQSNLAVNYYNAFGMGYPYTRPSTNIGKVSIQTPSEGTLEFSVYRSWFQSCIDRLLWDEYSNVPYTGVIPYLEYIQSRGYATDPAYITKVAQLYKQRQVAITCMLTKGYMFTTLLYVLFLLVRLLYRMFSR